VFDDENKVNHAEREHFRKWNCFVVWSKDAEKLRCISVYYNRTNHFVVVQPSWATNILGAYTVWEEMGRPVNLKPTKSIGVVIGKQPNVENKKKRDNFQVFDLARVVLKCSRPLLICLIITFNV